MKTILVEGYFKNNLGDDLFLDILVNRYKDVNFAFLTPSYDNIKRFANHPRVQIISNKEVLKGSDKYIAYVIIGGSLFQQPQRWLKSWLITALKISKFNKNKTSVFLLGCNFGPYTNPLYLKIYGKLFKTYNFISVRDKKSYNLISKYNTNTRFYPDIVFMGKDTIPKVKKKKIIGISIMDFGFESKNILYKETMIKIIEKISKSYKIRLFSFQDTEIISDLKIINEILEQLDTTSNIEVVNYDGDIEMFLEKYAECSTFLTSRFHSLILSIISNQNIIAINYNEKVENTIKSLDLNVQLIDIKSFNGSSFEISNNLIDFLDLENNRNFNLQEITENAFKHFEELDYLVESE